MARLIWRVILVWLAVGLAWLSLGPTANATTMRGDPLVCSSFSMAAYDVAQMRDAGVPWETFAPWITNALDEALKNPNSYVKDVDDVAYIFGWFKRIWDNPKTEAVEIVRLVEADCLKQPSSFKRKKVQV